MQPIEMQLSKKLKNLSQLFSLVLKATISYKIFETNFSFCVK